MTPLLDFAATPLDNPPRLWWGSQDGGGYDTGNLGRTHRILRAGQVPDGRPVPASLQRFAAGRVVATAAPDLRAWWRAAGVDVVVLPIFFHRGHLFVGPRLDRASGLCPTCLALRLGQAAPHPAVYRTVLEGAACSSDRTGARLLEGFLDDAAARLDRQVRAAARLPGHCFTLTAEGGGGWQRRTVVAAPGSHPDHDCQPWVAALIPRRPPWAARPARRRLAAPPLDPLVGPLLRTAAVPIGTDAPARLAAFVTTAGFLGRMTRWESDVTGSGVGFDAGAARGASIGEAVERYCGNFVPADRLRLASETALAAAGEPFVGHAAFGANQQRPGPAAAWFRPHRSDEAEYWLAGSPLDEPHRPATLLPAEAVILNFTRYSRRGALFPVVLAGIAAGTSPASAALAATLELVERDATMVWWYGGRPAARITGVPTALAERIGAAGGEGDVDLWFLRLPAAVPVCVVAACLHDRRHDILVTGYAARGDAAAAVSKAAAEAWQLRHLSRLLLDADGPLWPEITSGRLPLPVVDHRPDRSYAGAFRADHADLHQLAFHLQYFLDPRTHPGVLRRLRPAGTVAFSDVAGGGSAPLDLSAVVGACRAASVPLWSVDLTTDDMAAAGYSVQRVVAPGLAGNTPAAFVPFWHPRLAPAPDGAPLYREPMPHA